MQAQAFHRIAANVTWKHAIQCIYTLYLIESFEAGVLCLLSWPLQSEEEINKQTKNPQLMQNAHLFHAFALHCLKHCNTQSAHHSYQQCKRVSIGFSSRQFQLLCTGARATLYVCSSVLHTCTHTFAHLTHQAVGARSFTVQSGFIACDLMVILLAAIASFPIPWCPLVK